MLQNLTGHQATMLIQYPEYVLINAPILHYPDLYKCYIVYTDASDDTHGAQLPLEYNGQELPVAFLSHLFTDTHQKWSIPKQEIYRVYYAVANQT